MQEADAQPDPEDDQQPVSKVACNGLAGAGHKVAEPADPAENRISCIRMLSLGSGRVAPLPTDSETCSQATHTTLHTQTEAATEAASSEPPGVVLDEQYPAEGHGPQTSRSLPEIRTSWNAHPSLLTAHPSLVQTNNSNMTQLNVEDMERCAAGGPDEMQMYAAPWQTLEEAGRSTEFHDLPSAGTACIAVCDCQHALLKCLKVEHAAEK